SSGSCNMKSLGHSRRDFASIGYLIVPFGYRSGNVDDIGFLERIGAQQVGKYLTRNTNNGIAVDHGVGQSGNQVGSPGTAGGKYHAHTAGRSGISLRSMDAPLFVAH